MASDDRSWEAERPWATGATHEDRWDGYLDAETGMLRTRSAEPIHTQEELRDFEDSRATIRAMELRLQPIRGDFGIEHLQAIHRHLFQDVYPWAGEIRTVGIQKEGQGFLPPEHAGIVVDGAARMMHEDGMLSPGMDNARWSSLLADRFNDVNTGGSALSGKELFHSHDWSGPQNSGGASSLRPAKREIESTLAAAPRDYGRSRSSRASASYS